MTEKELALRLENDPKFFIETFFWIVDKERRSRRFIFNPPQQKFYAERSQNDLILKARKEGFSTLIEAMFLHKCLFKQNTNCVTMAHTLEETKVHLNRVRHFLDTMGGPQMRVEVKLGKDNQSELHFPETASNYWIGTAGAKGFGRGRDITDLHLSEVAHYESPEVLTGVMEACVPGAWKVLETTANGLETFYRMWKEAQDPAAQSSWKQHFFPWFADPSNAVPIGEGVTFRPTSEEARMVKAYRLELPQINWWRKKRGETADKVKMVQEHPSNADEAFLFSGRHVFDLTRLGEMEQSIRAEKPGDRGDLVDTGQKIEFVANQEGYLTVYRFPRAGRHYLVCADVAEGIQDGDWSVAHVLDRSSWEQVACLRLRINPGAFGKSLVDLGILYNNAVLTPELNNHGWATVERIKAEKYPHLLNTRTIWPDEPERDGFPMLNQKIKSNVIDALRSAVNDRTMPLHNLVTVNEMQTFIEHEGKMEAMETCHDDCVTSLAIGAYCLKFLQVDETYAERVARTMPSSFMPRADAATARRNRAGY